MKNFIIRFSLFAILTSGTLAFAQMQIDWHTIDGGGTTGTGGPFALAGTIGQPDAQTAPVMNGGTFELTGGFWPVIDVCYCLADMNHDGSKDGADVQKFLSCLLASVDCSCADVDQANGVSQADVSFFVADLLSGSSCP
jgi:hypothetical protein